MVENAKIKKDSNATFWVIFKQCESEMSHTNVMIFEPKIRHF